MSIRSEVVAGKYLNKEVMINEVDSIKKSNQMSTARLNKGLTLQQMQLLSYAIYATQRNGRTEFIKADFEKKFNIAKYKTNDAKVDARRLMNIQFEVDNPETGDFKIWNIFSSIAYEAGTFEFKWHEDIVPHILDLKDRYVLTDLSVTANFKSSFSWILYDYLRGHYGHWFLNITKDALMELFGVSDKKSYQTNTGLFRKYVLDVAVAEINKFTELEVRYEYIKKGRSIVGFKIIWGTGKKVQTATQQQIDMLSTLADEVSEMYFDIVKIEDQARRERATEVLKFFYHMQENYLVPEVGITAQKSSELISQANHGFRILNELLERENMTPYERIYERDKQQANEQDGQTNIDDYLK